MRSSASASVVGAAVVVVVAGAVTMAVAVIMVVVVAHVGHGRRRGTVVRMVQELGVDGWRRIVIVVATAHAAAAAVAVGDATADVVAPWWRVLALHPRVVPVPEVD